MPGWPGIGSSYYSKEIPVRMIAEQTIDHKIISETRSALPRSEIAVLPDVKVAMAMNESVAGVCLPGLNGKIDFGAGLTGDHPVFRIRCANLFEHYWTKSDKIHSIS